MLSNINISDQYIFNNYSSEILKKFLSFKDLAENLNLDPDIEKTFMVLFESKLSKKKNNNILKNPKLQEKKHNISNKINLILNKLTENNINNLILEFIDTIGLIDKIQFEEVQKVFYIKILTDIKFLKIYLEFLKIITYIYNKFYEIKISDIYTLEYFFSIIELKFKKNYLNIKLNNKFAFIDNFTDDKYRENNLFLIMNLVDYNLMNPNLLNYCDNIILKQKFYFSDIYFWYSKRQLDSNHINQIKIILENNIINTRDKILLKNLIKV